MGRICRKLVSLFVPLLFVSALAAPRAFGDEGVPPVPPSPSDLDAAVHAAATPHAISFAKTNFRQVNHIDPGQVSVAGHGTPVYALNPDFVLGKTGVPAGALQYIAVTVTAPGGETATLRSTSKAPGAWKVASAISGNDEEVLSKRLRPGSVLLNEPQINGWYELTPTGVVLLRASLPQSPVGGFVSLADYQRQVHERYADKMPGSDYQKNGGIGFKQNVATPAEPSADSGASPLLAAGIAGAAVLVALGGALALRLRAKKRDENH
ncbi:hypothetical protein [Amycolatopsis sp. CA-230715]|uniref:hypothetical protein n=1 Tax=Amycolatopsis sp. CA-230715 TaxID=2745196 RepID=UPI001C00B502|nr:hypothetical protein [Amycolatopsis sp. CA-230715]QWF78848.1 hypothetical protein HUW46_02246 [Amycolatopsis sp. CA-230715]